MSACFSGCNAARDAANQHCNAASGRRYVLPQNGKQTPGGRVSENVLSDSEGLRRFGGVASRILGNRAARFGRNDRPECSGFTVEGATMKKIMRIGTMDIGRGRMASIFVCAEYDAGRLAMTGVIGPLPSGNALGGAGQIDMEFAHRKKTDNDSRYDNPISPDAIRFAAGWNKEKWLDLLDIWKRWHLNDMKAGSPAQEEYLRAHPVVAKYPESHYEKACKALADAGLNPDADGYAYGSAWKSEPLPTEVLAKITAFPDADQKPAWI